MYLHWGEEGEFWGVGSYWMSRPGKGEGTGAMKWGTQGHECPAVVEAECPSLELGSEANFRGVPFKSRRAEVTGVCC